jgi:hypothetical protein
MVKSVEATRSMRSRSDCMTSLDPTSGTRSVRSLARATDTSGMLRSLAITSAASDAALSSN